MWPMRLRRRFESALLHQARKSRAHTPFRGDWFRPGFQYSGLVGVQDLNAGNGATGSQSRIYVQRDSYS